MRFAAIADIHGNHLALEAVIADIRAQDIEARRNGQSELALASGWIRQGSK